VLRQIADGLHQVAGDSDLVGRLGGDEFLLVLQTPDDRLALMGIVNQVTEALNHRISWENEWISPGVSIGLSYARAGSGVTAARLVRAADGAMYATKRGKGTPVVTDAASVHTTGHDGA
jgi:diguanylate cyclase (GGDEF)-like protein